MKRTTALCFFLASAACFLFLGCAMIADSPASSIPDYGAMPTVCSAAVRVYMPTRFSEVEERSASIVEGKLLSSEAILTMDTYEGKEYVLGGYTVSEMEVLKVYKGNLSMGDRIQYVESYYINDASGTPTIVHSGENLPAVQGKGYLFLLDCTEDDEGLWYSSEGIEYGRYPILDATSRRSLDLSSATTRQLELCERADTNRYKEFYQEAIDKYMTD